MAALIRLSRSSWRLTSAARAEILVREKPPQRPFHPLLSHRRPPRSRLAATPPHWQAPRQTRRERGITGVSRTSARRSSGRPLIAPLLRARFHAALLGTRHRGGSSPGTTFCGSTSSGTTTDRPVLTTPGHNAEGADEKNAARAKKSNEPSGNRPRPRYTRPLITVFSGVP